MIAPTASHEPNYLPISRVSAAAWSLYRWIENRKGRVLRPVSEAEAKRVSDTIDSQLAELRKEQKLRRPDFKVCLKLLAYLLTINNLRHRS